ncbi:MAG: hypothetical protein ABI665_08285, partial [Vicinamibacterales bacterium]
ERPETAAGHRAADGEAFHKRASRMIVRTHSSLALGTPKGVPYWRALRGTPSDVDELSGGSAADQMRRGWEYEGAYDAYSADDAERAVGAEGAKGAKGAKGATGEQAAVARDDSRAGACVRAASIARH